MTITFACDCGQRLTARDEYAGEQVRCAVCGRSVLVPDASKPDAAPTKASARSAFPWSLVGVLVGLLVLAAGGVGVWYTMRPREAESDLDFIPASANRFVSLRLADTLERPAGKQFQEQLTLEVPYWRDDFERQTGLQPELIERATAVWPTEDDTLGWGVVLTRDPYDRDRVLRAICPSGTTARHAGRTYQVDRQKDWAAYAAGKRVLVVGNERGLRRCLEMMGKSEPGGALSEVRDKLTDGQYQIVAATASPPPLPGPGGRPALAAVQGGHLLGKVNETVEMEGQLRHKDEDGARTTVGLLNTFKQGGPVLAILGVQIPPPLKALLRKVEADQEGDKVNLRGRLTAEECLALMRLLAGPGSGPIPW